MPRDPHESGPPSSKAKKDAAPKKKVQARWRCNSRAPTTVWKNPVVLRATARLVCCEPFRGLTPARMSALRNPDRLHKWMAGGFMPFTLEL